MSSHSKAAGSSVGFLGWLQLLFIGLKLTGYITWAWWQVLLPLIISSGFFLAFLILLIIFAFISDNK
jgi:sugar phosphate permease